MKNLIITLTCLTLIGCGEKSYEGIYRNQFNHVLTIKDSTFVYVSYDGLQGEYYSYGKISTINDSIVLINDSIKNSCCYNTLQLKKISLKRKSNRNLKNSEYTFRR